MFWRSKTDETTTADLSDELRVARHNHSLAIDRLKLDHSLALKEKEFELKHYKDDEVAKLRDDLNSKKSDLAVLKKENEMLAKITDLNADIIDVKDLVGSLIKKLPEINISSLSVSSGDK